jgi:hypothetical protein
MKKSGNIDFVALNAGGDSDGATVFDPDGAAVLEPDGATVFRNDYETHKSVKIILLSENC